jgi:four helix bundle protein
VLATFVHPPFIVGVNRFEDLVVWRLATQLKNEVFAFTARGPASRDFKFCNQIRESARSVPRNIAEGFGRYFHKEFARFLGIAAASLHETKNHLDDAHHCQYLTDSDHARLKTLSIRCIRATNRLIRYLRSSDAPDPLPDDPSDDDPDAPPSGTGAP